MPGALGPRERVLVDSGAWIALASARDGRHADALRLFRAALAGRTELLTTTLIVAEVYRLLLFRAGRSVAMGALDRLDRSPSLRLVHPGDEHHRRAREWLVKLDDRAVSYTDAVSFAVAEAEACTSVMTFDDDFTIAGFRTYTD